MTSSVFLTTFFFFNDTATTEIYTLSLHDALPIFHLYAVQRARSLLPAHCSLFYLALDVPGDGLSRLVERRAGHVRSEEHTSELQSQSNLVCRLLLEKKKSTSSPLPLSPRFPM